MYPPKKARHCRVEEVRRGAAVGEAEEVVVEEVVEEVQWGCLSSEVAVQSIFGQGCLEAAVSWVFFCVWVQDGWRAVRRRRERGRG